MSLDTCVVIYVFFFQAEDGIRDLVRSRGLGDVYKRQPIRHAEHSASRSAARLSGIRELRVMIRSAAAFGTCLLYTSDAADERSSVDLGGRRIIKKKNTRQYRVCQTITHTTTSA